MRRFLILVLATLFLVPTAQAAPPAGEIGELAGAAFVQRTDGRWLPLRLGMPIFSGDLIATRRGAKVKILFRDASIITVGPSTRMRIDQAIYQPPPEAKRESLFSLLKGRVRALVSKWFAQHGRQRFEVRTPVGVAGVRGTEFVAVMEPGRGMEVAVFDGVVEVKPLDGGAQARPVRLAAGQTVALATPETPLRPQNLSRRQQRELRRELEIRADDQTAGGEEEQHRERRRRRALVKEEGKVGERPGRTVREGQRDDDERAQRDERGTRPEETTVEGDEEAAAGEAGDARKEDATEADAAEAEGTSEEGAFAEGGEDQAAGSEAGLEEPPTEAALLDELDEFDSDRLLAEESGGEPTVVAGAGGATPGADETYAGGDEAGSPFADDVADPGAGGTDGGFQEGFILPQDVGQATVIVEVGFPTP